MDRKLVPVKFTMSNMTTAEVEQMFMHNISSIMEMLDKLKASQAGHADLATNTNMDLMWVIICGKHPFSRSSLLL